MKKPARSKVFFFERLAQSASGFSGTTKAFIMALLLITVWLVSGQM